MSRQDSYRSQQKDYTTGRTNIQRELKERVLEQYGLEGKNRTGPPMTCKTMTFFLTKNVSEHLNTNICRYCEECDTVSHTVLDNVYKVRRKERETHKRVSPKI